MCLGPNAPQSLLDFFTSPRKVIDLHASKSCPSAGGAPERSSHMRHLET